MSDEFNDLGGGDFHEEEPPAPPRNNRLLLMGAGVLGALFFLGLAALAVYGLIIGPQMRNRQKAQEAQVRAEQTATALALAAQTASVNATVIAKAPTLEPTLAPTLAPTATATLRPTATNTPVTIITTIGSSTQQAAQANTAAPQQTQAAIRPSPTALPATGLAEEVGFPGLLGLAVGLIGVIFLARRLRSG